MPRLATRQIIPRNAKKIAIRSDRTVSGCSVAPGPTTKGVRLLIVIKATAARAAALHAEAMARSWL
jgi:hypothetical protein